MSEFLKSFAILWKAVYNDKPMRLVLTIGLALFILFYIGKGISEEYRNYIKPQNIAAGKKDSSNTQTNTLKDSVKPPVVENKHEAYSPISNRNKEEIKSNLKKDTIIPKTQPTVIGNNNHTVIGENNGVNGDVIIGDQPRIVTKENLNDFFLKYPDKNTRIAIDFIGMSETSEMENVKNQIIEILSNNGYNNIGRKSGHRILNGVTYNIIYQPEQNGSVFILVPPK